MLINIALALIIAIVIFIAVHTEDRRPPTAGAQP